MARSKGENRSKVTSEGDTYITPRWLVDFLIDFLPPDVFCQTDCVLDPCACGINGYSIGKELGEKYRVPYMLGDIAPKHDFVLRRDFAQWDGHIPQHSICVTNPPYNLLEDFVTYWRSRVPYTIVLCRLGYLSTGGGAHAEGLRYVLLPTKRVAFELLEEDALRMRSESKTVLKSKAADSVTGWEMQTSAVDHCWAVYSSDAVIRTDLIIRKPKTSEMKELECYEF